MSTPKRLTWRRGELTRLAGVLLALAVLVYGRYVATSGLFYDDWTLAGIAAEAAPDGPDAVVGAFVGADNFLGRPVLMAMLAATHLAFGDEATGFLVVAVLAAMVASLGLYALLREVGLPIPASAAIASLLLLFPWASVTRLWASSGMLSLALALGLWGATVSLRSLRLGGAAATRNRLGGLALLFLATSTYEAVAPPLLVVLAVVTWSRVGLRRAAVRSVADVLVVGLALLIVQTGRATQPQPLSASLDHAAVLVDQSLTVLARAAVPFGTAPRIPVLLGLVLIAAVGIAAVRSGRLPESHAREVGRWLAVAGVAVLVVLAAYLMYVPAYSWYMPLQPGHGNRVNTAASVGYVTLLVALVSIGATLAAALLRRPVGAASVAGGLVLVVLAVGYVRQDTADARRWDAAAGVQEEVLRRAEGTLGPLRPGTTVYAYGHPFSVDVNVPVFVWADDFSGALRVALDREDVSGLPVLQGMTLRCGPTGFLPEGGVYPVTVEQPYGAAVFLDVATRSRFALGGPADCQAQNERLVAATAGGQSVWDASLRVASGG